MGVRYQFSEDPRCTLTVAAPDGKALRLVALAPGEAPAWLAVFSNTAGLCLFALPGGCLGLPVSPPPPPLPPVLTGHVSSLSLY